MTVLHRWIYRSSSQWAISASHLPKTCCRFFLWGTMIAASWRRKLSSLIIMFSKEIRAAAIEGIKAANQRRREEMVAKVGRQLYALPAAQNRAKLNSPVASSNPVHGGEQDANYDASANSEKEEKKGKETVTSPSSTDQQMTDDASVTGELLDPETDSMCPCMGKRERERVCVYRG